MKLLTEFVGFADLEVISEGKESGDIRIKGPFLQAEIKNNNGRIYTRGLCEREIQKFMSQKIEKNRALGELDHPPTPTVNLNRVSHKIESLVMEGNNGIGVAKLIDTPMGKIAQTLVKEGIILGVSSRGLGTVGSNDKVNEDYNLITVDIVADPSAPDAFVNGILENKEFVIDGNEIVEVAVKKLQEKVDKNAKSKELLNYIKSFIDDIS